MCTVCGAFRDFAIVCSVSETSVRLRVNLELCVFVGEKAEVSKPSNITPTTCSFRRRAQTAFVRHSVSF